MNTDPPGYCVGMGCVCGTDAPFCPVHGPRDGLPIRDQAQSTKAFVGEQEINVTSAPINVTDHRSDADRAADEQAIAIECRRIGFTPSLPPRRTIHGPHAEGDPDIAVAVEYMRKFFDARDSRNRWRTAALLLVLLVIALAVRSMG